MVFFDPLPTVVDIDRVRPAVPVALPVRVTVPSPLFVYVADADALFPAGPEVLRECVTLPSPVAVVDALRVTPLLLVLVTLVLRCADAKLAVTTRRSAVRTRVRIFMFSPPWRADRRMRSTPAWQSQDAAGL